DLVLNCFARVSRLDYPILSLVCKRLIPISPCLNKASPDPNPLRPHRELSLHPNQTLWFTFCRPTPNSSKNILIPVSSPNLPPCSSSSQVSVVGPNIYFFGGLVNVRNNKADPSSSIMVLDSHSHEWHEQWCGGGCKDINSTNWMEVFDTKTQTWDFLQIPSEEICRASGYKSVTSEGAVYVKCEAERVTYKLHKGIRWRADVLGMNMGWRSSSSLFVIENVLYLYSWRVYWYQLQRERLWKDLKGLEIYPRLSLSDQVKLIDYGGKMAVLWDEYECGMKKKI
ncbi:hypothetical protein BRARA_F02694, partial [Brassica rapa]